MKNSGVVKYQGHAAEEYVDNLRKGLFEDETDHSASVVLKTEDIAPELNRRPWKYGPRIEVIAGRSSDNKVFTKRRVYFRHRPPSPSPPPRPSPSPSPPPPPSLPAVDRHGRRPAKRRKLKVGVAASAAPAGSSHQVL
jgi:hypothetical protein